jgi:hypothetical protein
VVLLGSAPLLLQRGLTESLAGRFEVVYLPHWTFVEHWFEELRARLPPREPVSSHKASSN